MLRVNADDPHYTLTMAHLALVANFFNRRSYLHSNLLGPVARGRGSAPDSFPTILPRVGSWGANSTSTRSPGTSLTKFLFTAPTRWAKTRCWFSSTTAYTAEGRSSTTVAATGSLLPLMAESTPTARSP